MQAQNASMCHQWHEWHRERPNREGGVKAACSPDKAFEVLPAPPVNTKVRKSSARADHSSFFVLQRRHRHPAAQKGPGSACETRWGKARADHAKEFLIYLRAWPAYDSAFRPTISRASAQHALSRDESKTSLCTAPSGRSRDAHCWTPSTPSCDLTNPAAELGCVLTLNSRQGA